MDLIDLTYFSDEARFHLFGYVNSQNTRMWSSENPHFFVEFTLHPQKIGVWLTVSRRRIVGPIFFHDTVTAHRYRNNILNPFVEQLFDDELRFGYFQQDGATAHTTAETINYLRNFFDDRLISFRTDIEFPTRLPCLTVMDYFIFPHLKNNIFKTPVKNLEQLQERIIQECGNISPEMLVNAFENMKRRVNLCLEYGGGQFQQFI